MTTNGTPRLTAVLLAYITTKPDGVYIHDAAANVLGSGSYPDIRRALGNLTNAGLLTHTATGRDGVWADRWQAADIEDQVRAAAAEGLTDVAACHGELYRQEKL